MSLNPNARTETVEVLLSPTELSGLDIVCKAFGIARSTFLRGLSNNAVRTHGTAQQHGRESRRCPGPGRAAGRARGVATSRRHL